MQRGSTRVEATSPEQALTIALRQCDEALGLPAKDADE